MKKCVIIDYGLCNLLSVYNSLKYLGIESLVIHDPQDLKHADLAILPGVGAFEDGMRGVRERGFIEPINDFVRTGKPFLGICLGMQILMSKSYEFGEHEGLDLIPGEVLPFEAQKEGDEYILKVPHVGWSGLQKKDAPWEGTPLAGIPDKSEVYFVHSFYVQPKNSAHVLAETEYGEKNFCSVVFKDNVYGCQFHPEKSSKLGLKILDNFIKLK